LSAFHDQRSAQWKRALGLMGVFAIALLLVPPLPPACASSRSWYWQCWRCSVFFQDGERPGGGT